MTNDNINLFRAAGTTPPFPATFIPSQENSTYCIPSKSKLEMYKEALKVFSAYAGFSVIADIVNLAIKFIPIAKLGLIRYFSYLTTAIGLVFFLIYLFNINKMGKMLNNKILSKASTLMLVGVLGSMASSILFVFLIVFNLIIWGIVYGDKFPYFFTEEMVAEFFHNPVLLGFTISILLYIVIILVLLIISYVGKYKEFNGHIAENSNLGDELINEYSLAKQWFTISIFSSVILIPLYFVVRAKSENIFLSNAVLLSISVLGLIPLWFKYKALKKTVNVLEEKSRD